MDRFGCVEITNFNVAALLFLKLFMLNQVVYYCHPEASSANMTDLNLHVITLVITYRGLCKEKKARSGVYLTVLNV